MKKILIAFTLFSLLCASLFLFSAYYQKPSPNKSAIIKSKSNDFFSLVEVITNTYNLSSVQYYASLNKVLVTDSVVFGITKNDELLALSRQSAELLWKVENVKPFSDFSSLDESGDSLFLQARFWDSVGNISGSHFYVVDKSSGKIKWTQTFENVIELTFIGSQDGVVYLAKSHKNPQENSQQHLLLTIEALDTETGAKIFSINSDLTFPKYHTLYKKFYLHNDYIVLSTNNIRTHCEPFLPCPIGEESNLLTLDIKAKRLRHTRKLVDGINNDISFHKNVIYFIEEVRKNDREYKLVGLNITNGKLISSTPLNESIIIAVESDKIILSNSTSIYALSLPEKKKIWETPMSYRAGRGKIFNNTLYSAGFKVSTETNPTSSDPGSTEIVAIDLLRGEIPWQQSIDGPSKYVRFEKDTIYVATMRNLKYLNTQDGSFIESSL
jgi:outer membrane protein assembly factor BamB